MKNYYFIIAVLSFTLSQAQVGIGTTDPDPDAILDLNSNNKGFLLPRVDDAAMAAMQTDGLSAGMIVFNTDQDLFMGWNGSRWLNISYQEANLAPTASSVTITGTKAVDEIVNGNYIFNDLNTDPDDNSTFQWYTADDNSGLNTTAIIGATSTNFTITSSETGKFIQFCVVPGSSVGATPGAQECSPWEGPVTLPQTSVEFVNTTSTLAEDGLFIEIELAITNPSTTNDTSLDITLNGSSTATNGTDYDDGEITPAAISFPLSVTFLAGSSANQSISIFISNDDTDPESDETVILDIQNVSGGNNNNTTIGANSQHVLTIEDNDSVTLSAVQDFDSQNTWNYTLTNPTSSYNTSGDVWDIVTSLGGLSMNGNFWGAQDLENPNGGGNFKHILTFDTIDTSSFSNVVLSFDYVSRNMNVGSDRYGYELFYDGMSQGEVNLCAGCDTPLSDSVSVNVPDTVDSVSLVLYGQFNGGTDTCGFDNVSLISL